MKQLIDITVLLNYPSFIRQR